MKVAVLWTRMSGYLNACLRELASRDGVELFLSDFPHHTSAPYDDAQFSWITNRLLLQSRSDFAPLIAKLEPFNPDVLVFCSWNVPAYRKAALHFRNKAFRVVGMDNCWLATPKQWLGVLSSSWYVRPLADAVWLPGERQAVFARKLGFQERDILRGLYSCDQPLVEKVHLARVAEGRGVPRAFLFVGRIAPEKGIDTLIRAYEIYRTKTPDPWPLICCGAGPMESHLQGRPGIRVEGFVQPQNLMRILASAGFLILPSNFEPWGLVINEATSAGLIILASGRVGAGAHLVQDGYNGYVFDHRDIEGLSLLMSQVGMHSDARLDAMSRASNLLSKQFSPARWADTLLSKAKTFFDQNGEGASEGVFLQKSS